MWEHSRYVIEGLEWDAFLDYWGKEGKKQESETLYLVAIKRCMLPFMHEVHDMWEVVLGHGAHHNTVRLEHMDVVNQKCMGRL